MSTEKIPRRSRAHVRYKLADGTIVPGVTTILGVLAKPALIGWANRLGLEGIDSTKYVDEKADIGTCCHYLIECDLKGTEPDVSEFSPAVLDEASNGFLKWLDWKSGHGLELLGSELSLVSETYRYGGTVDVYCELDSVPTLLDIKTSGSGIWPEMKHQVAAYARLLEENGNRVQEVYILRVGRNEDEGFEYQRLGGIDKHWEMFTLCRRIYDLQKELRK